jgi:hypothetical protein
MEGEIRAIGYPRVSTEYQSKDGASLAHQIAQIRAYAELKDSELVEIVGDDGASAKTSIAQEYSMSRTRPGLRRYKPWWLSSWTGSFAVLPMHLRLPGSLKNGASHSIVSTKPFIPNPPWNTFSFRSW